MSKKTDVTRSAQQQYIDKRFADSLERISFVNDDTFTFTASDDDSEKTALATLVSNLTTQVASSNEQRFVVVCALLKSELQSFVDFNSLIRLTNEKQKLAFVATRSNVATDKQSVDIQKAKHRVRAKRTKLNLSASELYNDSLIDAQIKVSAKLKSDDSRTLRDHASKLSDYAVSLLSDDTCETIVKLHSS